ncbi:MAG: HAMP domain-containing sensor histidine kinase [Candidatus Acidiferrales bacterium]
MTLLRLRTQLLVGALLVLCALAGALLLTIRFRVRAAFDRQVLASTDASLKSFAGVQRQREIELSRTAELLAELPTLKALMTTEHAPTVQDGSAPFWRLAGSDLLLLADPAGRVLGLHVKQSGWRSADAEAYLRKSLDDGSDTAWWYANGQLYWIFLRPIVGGAGSNADRLGFIALGYQVDSTVAQQLALASGSEIVLATGDKVIASTLPVTAERDMADWLAHTDPGARGAMREVQLGDEPYELASVLIHDGPPAAVRCYVLMSLAPADAFVARLNRTIVLFTVIAVLLAALLLNFLSRTITHPLDNLVAGVRALAAGDFSYAVTPRGSREVVELNEAFLKMRADILTSQQRRIAIERVAALGRAASSISHDLRHYLAAVVANAEFLYEAEELKLDKAEVYQEIKTASEQMVDLLDSLRELAREDASISPAPAWLDQAIGRSVEAVLMRPELRTRTVTVGNSGEMDGVFDSKKIERVFFNLILNACEAAPQRAGRVCVDIVSTVDSFDVRVRDNGPGIPSAILEALFDPFVSSGKPNGTGLGLAIVNKIVHDHGGSVAVIETSDQGTTFRVRLPRACRPANALEQVSIR